MKKSIAFGLLAVLIAGTACMRDTPTAPVAESETHASASPRLADEAVLNLNGAIDDVIVRILPSLENHAAVDGLTRHLNDLSAKLHVGDWVQAARALVRAQGALQSGDDSASGQGHTADTTVIQLVLDRAEVLLSGQPDYVSSAR